MTKNFDTLLEQMLSEMMPADIEGMGGIGGAVERIKKGVPEGEPKGHWAPLQKLSPEDRDKVLEQIFKEVFSEKENTYAPTVDNPEELHGAIQSAIQKISGSTELKAAAKYASKFLADRMMTLLKNNVKYTTSSGVETLQKEMTQKEFKQALKQALEEAPEEPSSEEPTKISAEEPKKTKEYSYNPSAEYYLKSYEEIPSGKLKGDVQVAYDRLSGMAGEAHSGSDFAKTLKNSQMSISFLKQLFDLGILEFAESDLEDTGDTKGFDETTEEYMDRLTKDARRDYAQSSPGSRFGGEDVFG